MFIFYEFRLFCIDNARVIYRKIRYSFVNRTIKHWNQLPAFALGTFPCKPEIFSKEAGKEIINGVK